MRFSDCLSKLCPLAPFALLVAPAMPQASFQVLPAPPGYYGVTPMELSADGSTLALSGALTDLSPPQDIMRLHDGGPLRTIPVPAGYTQASVIGMSPDGATLMGGASNLSLGIYDLWLWNEASGFTFLPLDDVQAVTNGGAVVAGAVNNGSLRQAALWTPGGGVQLLGTLPQHNQSWAFGVSADGSAVAGASYANGSGVAPGRAFYWTASGGMVDLGVLPGAYASWGTDISADGTTVVGHSDRVPFRWTAGGGMQAIWPASTIGPEIYPSWCSVSGDGNAVVGYLPSRHAFYWSPSTGPVGLAAYLSGLGAIGAAPYASALWSQVRISDDGRAVSAVAGFPGGGGGAIHARFAPREPERFGTDYCGQILTNSLGLVASLDAFGSVATFDNEVTLAGRDLPPNQFALLLSSDAPGLIVSPGQGDLCLGGPIGRYHSLVQNSGALGRTMMTLDLPNTPTPTVPTTIFAGDTWYFQLWHRDVGATSRFSSALEIEFQ
ncbi:MAG: hypothetical protein R3F33_11485 [Planctomycetota bacterium]